MQYTTNQLVYKTNKGQNNTIVFHFSTQQHKSFYSKAKLIKTYIGFFIIEESQSNQLKQDLNSNATFTFEIISTFTTDDDTELNRLNITNVKFHKKD